MFRSSICLFLMLFATLAGANNQIRYAPGEIIVKLANDDASKLNSIIKRLNAESSQKVFPNVSSDRISRLHAIYRIRFPVHWDVTSVINECSKESAIEYCQPNYINRPCYESMRPNDPFYPDQWGLEAIQVPRAWRIEKGSSDVIVAVIDSGIDYNHEDLKTRIWRNPDEHLNGVDDDKNGYVDDIIGWDFTDVYGITLPGDTTTPDNDPMDEDGHGTHVAGIIAAEPGNSKGVAGVTWNCKVMPLRCGNDYYEDDDAASAIVYAADNGARIINMSWGSDNMSYIIRDAIDYAHHKGCILVAAVGNDNKDSIIYPAGYNKVIAVASTNRKDKRSFFSNYGIGIDIAAPGERIFSTVPKNHYSSWQGTSMATPMVCGVIALMLSRRPSLSSKDVREILRSTSDRIDEPSLRGIGRLNAFKALSASSSLIASIDSPENGSSAHRSFTIRGSAGGIGFNNFILEYSKATDQKTWIPMTKGNAQVFQEPIYKWEVINLPEGSYVIRLRTFGEGQRVLEDKVMVNVVHSPPKLKLLEDLITLQDGKFGTQIHVSADMPCHVDLYYRLSKYRELPFERISSDSISTEHYIDIPEGIPPGKYDYYVVLTNAEDMTTIDNNHGNYYTVSVSPSYARTDGFEEKETGLPSVYPISARSDIDNDGKPEMIAMMAPEYSYEQVGIFEMTEDGTFTEIFRTKEAFFPRALDDVDGDGILELLGNDANSSFLFKISNLHEHSMIKSWEVRNVKATLISDIDKDDKKEILVIDRDTGNIRLYENRGVGRYVMAATLKNVSEGQNIVNSCAIGDFNGNGSMEVVIGDSDGDIYIYESDYDDSYSLTWRSNIGRFAIRSIKSGNFDGDGIDDFAIISLCQVPDQLRIRWRLIVFNGVDAYSKLQSSDYQIAWSIDILSSEKRCGMGIGDIDADGVDEIVVLSVPHLYIVDMPYVWRYQASDTYEPVVSGNDILFNKEDKLIALRFKLRPVSPPWGLFWRWIDDDSVLLYWNGQHNIKEYRVYRKIDTGGFELMSTRPTILKFEGRPELCYYSEDGLKKGFTYSYYVTAVTTDGIESVPSEVVSLSPKPAPRLLSAEFKSPHLVLVYFSKQVGHTAQDKNRYVIRSESGEVFRPSSVILDSNNTRAMLSFELQFMAGRYTVQVTNVFDPFGIPIPDTEQVSFQVPPPRVAMYNDLRQAVVYPNPVVTGSKHFAKLEFDRLPPGSKISIFDINGRQIKRMESNNSKCTWLLDNDDGRKVAGGIFIYVIECSGDRKVGKIAILP